MDAALWSFVVLAKPPERHENNHQQKRPEHSPGEPADYLLEHLAATSNPAALAEVPKETAALSELLNTAAI